MSETHSQSRQWQKSELKKTHRPFSQSQKSGLHNYDREAFIFMSRIPLLAACWTVQKMKKSHRHMALQSVYLGCRPC